MSDNLKNWLAALGPWLGATGLLAFAAYEVVALQDYAAAGKAALAALAILGLHVRTNGGPKP
jgi:hypothetical protein